MAPLTRLRADGSGVLPDFSATYYQQRSTYGGLIIAEATNITATARGYLGSPGIFTQEQVDSWKAITQAVHDKGGVIFLQLCRLIECQHAYPGNPSGANRRWYGLAHEASCFGGEQIPQIAQDYHKAAENALAASFGGVEIHAANRYLPEHFLQDGINDRTDQYGGPSENRAHFLFEVIEEVLKSVDSSKVGVRLSPYGKSFDQKDSDPTNAYKYVFEKLNDYDLAYAHITEPRGFHYENELTPKEGATAYFRQFYNGVFMTSSGYERESAIEVIEVGHADIVSIGRYFISNPDLVKRLELNAPLAVFDYSTFYMPGKEGYIDYPFLSEEGPRMPK